MKYKLPKRFKPTPLEVGFNQEVRKLRQERTDLSVRDCQFMILSEYEDEVILTESDKEWLRAKRAELIVDRKISKRARKADSDTLDKLVDDLFK